MPLYDVLYLDEKGNKNKKKFDLDSKERIYKILKNIYLFGNEVDQTTIILFARQLGAMLGAGIPILDAVETLIRDQENPKFKETLKIIVDDISAGLSFSDAIAKYPKLFNNLFVNMIKSAEQAGGLSLTLISISEYLEKIKDIKDRVKSATRYPLIVFAFVLLSTTGMVIFIVPRFEQIYIKLGADLPLVTKILMNISKFAQTYFLLIIFFLILIFILIKYLINHKENIRFFYH